MSWICAVTGDESDGKHYVLKTTEGEELVSAAALFGNPEDAAKLLKAVERLRGRVEQLENLLHDQEQEGGKQEQEGGKVAEAAKKAAAPVKRSRARDQSS
jgi:hypothetical protein